MRNELKSDLRDIADAFGLLTFLGLVVGLSFTGLCVVFEGLFGKSGGACGAWLALILRILGID